MNTSFYPFAQQLYHRLMRPLRLSQINAQESLKIYYGCGPCRQDGYVNVDLRWTPAVDLIADLNWCAKHFGGRCQEVYLSHVLEHYRSPGRDMRDAPDTVIGALRQIHRMLVPNGVVRLAVPDFGTLARLYVEGQQELYPRLLGRLVGEQDYPQNRHGCAFDRAFLERLLLHVGFREIQEWIPQESGLAQDSSFDRLDGVPTSLNLLARK